MLSHYQVLGVKSNARVEEIRAAYIDLMKRYHPDAVGTDRNAALRAGEINRAYAILRDPEQRARHDADIRFEREAEERRVQAAFAPYPPAQRRQPLGKRPAGILLALAFLGAVSFYFGERPDFAVPFSPEEMLFGTDPDALVPTKAEVDAAGARMDPVDYGTVSDAVADFDWIASKTQIAGAEDFSRQCFAELKGQPSLRLFDRCAAFDLAVSFWNSSSGSKYGTPLHEFFSPEVREERHQQALAALSKDRASNAARLMEIEKNTISAMADRLIRTRTEAEKPDA